MSICEVLRHKGVGDDKKKRHKGVGERKKKHHEDMISNVTCYSLYVEKIDRNYKILYYMKWNVYINI